MSALVRKERFATGLMLATFDGNRLGLPFAREIFLLETHVAGSSWHDAGEIEVSRLVKGGELTLVRQPANPHDPHAIEVRVDDKRLGYVPRTQNEVVARLMDAGKAFVARIVLSQQHETWLEVRFRLWMKDG